VCFAREDQKHKQLKEEGKKRRARERGPFWLSREFNRSEIENGKHQQCGSENVTGRSSEKKEKERSRVGGVGTARVWRHSYRHNIPLQNEWEVSRGDPQHNRRKLSTEAKKRSTGRTTF